MNWKTKRRKQTTQDQPKSTERSLIELVQLRQAELAVRMEVLQAAFEQQK